MGLKEGYLHIGSSAVADGANMPTVQEGAEAYPETIQEIIDKCGEYSQENGTANCRQRADIA